jgi:hypothetical protein
MVGLVLVGMFDFSSGFGRWLSSITRRRGIPAGDFGKLGGTICWPGCAREESGQLADLGPVSFPSRIAWAHHRRV